MVLKENEAKYGMLKPEILGTDISLQVLHKAQAGVYSQFEVQRGLPMTSLVKYFDQQGQNWVIKPALAANVTFKKFNLLDNFSSLGKWDVVFCRNVLIYFDQPTKSDILRRISQQLAPDGFLFLGAAESTMGVSDAFAPVKGLRGLYRLSSCTAEMTPPKKAAAAGA